MDSDETEYFESELGDSQVPLSRAEVARGIYRNFQPFRRPANVTPPPMRTHSSEAWMSSKPPSTPVQPPNVVQPASEIVRTSQPSIPPKPKEKSPRLPEWEQRELKILVTAKRWEWDTIDSGKDVQKKMVSSVGKWRKISDFCVRNGLTNPVRDGTSCKKRWESLSTMWRKVFDYEEHIPSGKPSYFAMSTIKRREMGLPLNFDDELYALIIDWYPEREDIQPKDSVLMDTIRLNERLNKAKSKDKGKEVEDAPSNEASKEVEEGPIDLDDYENEDLNLFGETPDDVGWVDANGKEIPPSSKATTPKSGDDFEGAEKRPISRGRKKKSMEKDGDKEKEPSIATTAHGLLEHLRMDGLRREKKDEGLAKSFEKMAESSAIAGKSMQAVADALLALVAQQAAMHK